MWLLDVSARVVTPSSKLVAQTNAGIVVGRLVAGIGQGNSLGVDRGTDKAVRKTALHLRPHHAGVHVHMLGKAPVEDQRDRVQRAGAARGDRRRAAGSRGVGTVTDHKAVLPLVIVGAGDVERRGDRVANTK